MIPKDDKFYDALAEFYREITTHDRTIFGLYYGYPLGPEDRLTIEEIAEAMSIEPLEVSQRYETIMARLADKLRE